jgi:short-subunit dehydrogenase
LSAGATVTIAGRDRATIDAALERLARFGSNVAGVATDVRVQADCERLVASAIERYGPIDILVNDAGVIEVGPFADQTLGDVHEALATHFWGPLYLMLAVLPAMCERRSGRIVNIASIGGVVGVPHLAPYAASKFAQIGLTQAVGAEVAASGVRLTSVIPGLMRTGSPDRAVFKGRNRAEYAWFTISDVTPLLSESVDAAARRIIRATRRGQATVVIGVTARAAMLVNALLPQTTAAALAFAARLLPPPGGIGTARRSGSESHSAWTGNVVSLINRRAMEATNELPPRDPANRTAD